MHTPQNEQVFLKQARKAYLKAFCLCFAVAIVGLALTIAGIKPGEAVFFFGLPITLGLATYWVHTKTKALAKTYDVDLSVLEKGRQKFDYQPASIEGPGLHALTIYRNCGSGYQMYPHHSQYHR